MNRLNLIALAVFTGLLVWVFTFDSPKTRLIQTRVNAAFASFKRSGAEVQGALSGNADVQKLSLIHLLRCRRPYECMDVCVALDHMKTHATH